VTETPPVEVDRFRSVERAWLARIDQLIPPAIRHDNADLLRRARLGISGWVFALAGLTWVALIQLSVGTPAVGYGALAAALLLTPLPLVLQRTASLALSVNLLVGLIFAFLASVAASSGGENVGIVYAFPLIPLYAILGAGARAGWIWGGIACATLAAIALLKQANLDFPLRPEPEVVEAGRFRGAILVTLLVLGAALLYEWLKNRALDDVARARRKSTEDAARFRAIAENASDSIVEWDSQGRILFVSPWRAIEQTGFAPDSFEGTSGDQHLDLIAPEDLQGFRSAFRRALSTDDGTEVSYRLRHPNGGWRPIEATLRPFRTARGETHLVMVARDVSQRREVEELRSLSEALEESADDLARANRELEEFTSVASHDLQEPLRKIVAFGELLREDLPGDLPADAERDVKFIVDCARRAQLLVQNLLALSRAGVADMKREWTPLDDCVDRALESLQLQIEETGAQIHRSPLPEARVDATLLSGVYQNLVSNALKFRGNEAPGVWIESRDDESEIVLCVRDRGIGVRADQSEEIFEPFRRLHSSERYPGSGIGLAICRKSIERHGGRIWADPDAAGGLRVCFTLPDTRRQQNGG